VGLGATDDRVGPTAAVAVGGTGGGTWPGEASVWPGATGECRWLAAASVGTVCVPIVDQRLPIGAYERAPAASSTNRMITTRTARPPLGKKADRTCLTLSRPKSTVKSSAVSLLPGRLVLSAHRVRSPVPIHGGEGITGGFSGPCQELGASTLVGSTRCTLPDAPSPIA